MSMVADLTYKDKANLLSQNRLTKMLDQGRDYQDIIKLQELIIQPEVKVKNPNKATCHHR
jgi:hypothetical protein